MFRFNQGGQVIFTTLIFVTVLTMLSLETMEEQTAMLRLFHSRYQHSVARYQEEQLLKSIEQEVLSESLHCHIPWLSWEALARQSMQWWREHGCSHGKDTYYVIETLPAATCAFIDDKHDFAAKFYRLSWLVNGNIRQSTLAKPGGDPLSCHSRPHSVQMGRQMTRTFFQIMQNTKE